MLIQRESRLKTLSTLSSIHEDDECSIHIKNSTTEVEAILMGENSCLYMQSTLLTTLALLSLIPVLVAAC